MDRLARNAYMREWRAQNRDRVLALSAIRRLRPITKKDIIAASDRFWPNVEMVGQCSIWTGLRNWKGYGRISVRGRFVAVHRYAWMLFGFSIPDGMTIDHLCGNRACVRVMHLEVVTRSENAKRGWATRYARLCESCGDRSAWRHGLCGQCTKARAA